MSETDVYRGLLAICLCLLVVQTARLSWQRSAPARTLRKRVARAIAGEREAEALLEGAGYSIEARQPCADVLYRIDGEAAVFDVRADLLVRKRGKRYVAEVKTGEQATQLASRATRRQLLEYAYAFDAEGLLLIDADAKQVHVVEVPGIVRHDGTHPFVYAVAVAVALLTLGVAARFL